ncbi:MAG: phosphotransferase enzyme family protein [Gammaproteobacteria bacterium]
MSPKLTRVAAQFSRGPDIHSLRPLGNGLINDTYLVDDGVEPFVLQRLNPLVFPDPRQILENLATLQDHIQRQKAEKVRLRIPNIIPTSGGDSFYRDGDGFFWRAQQLIKPAESRNTVTNDEEAAQIGFALGYFHKLCADLDPAMLHDTLPGFHVTPSYLARYRKLSSPPPTTVLDAQYQFCRDFIEAHCEKVDILEDAKNIGELQERVIHGDPKLNNFLFVPGTNRIVSLIDLDTVKAGLLHYDIADCLRSCCHDKYSNGFNLNRCKIVLESYLQQTSDLFSGRDYDYLYPAIWLIPFELGLRFFTDYLSGDQYFKTNEPRQNLNRAMTQFVLCGDIERQQVALQKFIDKLRR